MNASCNFADIRFEIKGHIHVAPIHTHYILQHLSTLLKEISELERNGSQTKVQSHLSLNYAPVRKEDDPDIEIDTEFGGVA